MRIWKLTPVDPLGPIWKKWCPEPIIVRAECEAEARRLAGFVTNKTFALLTPMLTPVNPWFGYRKKGDIASQTLCVDMTGQEEYSADGPAEVLRHGEKF